MSDLFTGAGGIPSEINSGPQPLPNLPTPFSTKFLDFRRCVQAHIDACDVVEPDFGSPELQAWDAAVAAASQARQEACRVIRDRPVRSQQEFAELALVVRQELWQIEPDGSWRAHSTNEELEDALMRAVFTMVGGGIKTDPPVPLTSPRIERLRTLCEQLDNLPDDWTDDDVDPICREIYAFSNDIMAAPAPGLLGIVEHAMAVHYWFRPKGSASGPGGDVECVQALVAAVLGMAKGGANV